jgi:hypothetical protein
VVVNCSGLGPESWWRLSSDPGVRPARDHDNPGLDELLLELSIEPEWVATSRTEIVSSAEGSGCPVGGIPRPTPT